MNSLNRMTILSDRQIEQLREAAEDLLATTGFSVQHEGLLAMAKSVGASVDATGRVRLPPDLLYELIAQVPRSYKIRNIAGREFEVGGGRQGAFGITNDPWVVDYETGAIHMNRKLHQ